MGSYKFNIKGEDNTLIVYEDKVVLQGERGLLAAAVGVNQGEKTFSYESISSLEFEQATLMGAGRISFNIQGSSGRTGALGIGKMIIGVQNENTFQFQKRSLNAEALSAKMYIEQQMLKAKKASGQSVINQLSPADELRKYKQLLDDGIITQAEFDSKKKQLL